MEHEGKESENLDYSNGSSADVNEAVNSFDNTSGTNNAGNTDMERLRRIIKRGEVEDKILSPWWIAVIIFLDFVSFFSLIAYDLIQKLKASFKYIHGISKVAIHPSIKASAFLYTKPVIYNIYYVIAGIVVVITYIILIYIYVTLVSRRNKHFERTRELYETLADYLQKKGEKEIAWRVKEIARRCEIETSKRNVAGWVILSLIPIASIVAKPYMFHFLTRDYFVHERYEEMILDCLSEKFEKLRLVNLEYPNRDTVMYYLLSLITFGIFWFYWMYTLFADPNKHFKEHRMFEELLLEDI